MLVNFCDACLRTDVTCSTISTEGHEVTNLVNNSGKGFLAYSCIKPPVSIDFNFICNVQVSHVIIWPQVGAQKSCGFKLSLKSSDASGEPFTDVSTGFLQKEETGLLCYRRDLVKHEEIFVPLTFAHRYIRANGVSDYVSVLRLNILKTENSVPALGKIEIWGSVSPKCAKDIAMSVMALWSNRLNHVSNTPTIANANEERKQEMSIVQRDELLDSLYVPEDFLDPLTCEIMTQPVILPSGKIIDQKTLERHAQSEAIWGRPVSDPFTGIRFSDVHKPIAAVPLKARIDKFLVENSNRDDVRMLPRVLGSMSTHNRNLKLINCETLYQEKAANTLKIDIDQAKSIPTRINEHSKRTLMKHDDDCGHIAKRAFHGHSLPVSVMKNSATTRKNSKKICSNLVVAQEKIVNRDDIQKNNARIEEKFDLNVQVDNSTACKCCRDRVFYQLPCQHVMCRKALLSLEQNLCILCKLEFEKSDLQRIHLPGVDQ